MRHTHPTTGLFAAVIAVAILEGVSAGRQTTGPTTPPLVISSMAGADLYQAYCASCHGRGGKGDGPTGPALKSMLPDLTTLGRRNGGVFPGERIAALVAHGEELPSPAHGSREMPVWGPLFRALDPSDTRANVRIASIVEFIRSMQVR
ncbi:MAG: c-type cytochrome [Vicinamibacterales bacterium]